ncbi:host attachment protein [Hyalangium gracile]|uniref:host attachment protein n=1 Tax=Hyalangium gracile TaxID=394092 RepID=UPI001CC9AF19|nr:host attachment protein [Hyalangium gracile]
MADKLWILVGNASRVRLFSADEKGEDWRLVEEFRHDESRAHNGDLAEQRDNPNAGTLHGPPVETEPDARKELEHDRFARELSGHLDRGVDDHRFERLIIAAPPEFLGRLRKALSKRVLHRLMMDLDADYSNVPARDLPNRVPVI